MKRLRPILKPLAILFLEDYRPNKVERDFSEFILNYYEASFIRNENEPCLKVAFDAVDLVVLHERDDFFYAYWSRLHELFKSVMAYIRPRVGHFPDPIMGQGIFQEDQIRPCYDFNIRVLRAYAERKGFVVY